ncbi:MAG: hypothetical protein CMG64_03945 [Candidatus Marinimicrobia bacterium]|nr:hypothetical protein [Candidatus Neomarinimicrobiota bacterium]
MSDYNVIVKVSIASLYSDSTFKSEMVTQALKGENLIVLDKKNNWLKVRQWDDYISWIHSFYIEEYNDKNTKYMNQNESSVITISKMIEYGKSLVGTPYLWGGKTKLGFDCSGLIQTLFKMIGLKFPRDCSEQIKYSNMEQINLEDSDVGDLIFFSEKNNISHVCVFIDNTGSFLHCSGEVKINSIINKKSDLYSSKLKFLFHSVYRINRNVK